MTNGRQVKADVLQGTLDLMVMRTLRTLGPLHGYAIAAHQLETDTAEWDRMASIMHTLLHGDG